MQTAFGLIWFRIMIYDEKLPIHQCRSRRLSKRLSARRVDTACSFCQDAIPVLPNHGAVAVHFAQPWHHSTYSTLVRGTLVTIEERILR